MRRVVITGAGVVSSIGVGVEAFWDALAAGRSGAELVDADGVEAVACPVGDFDADALFGRRDARRMDRVAQLAAAAGRLALDDAGGDLGLPSERVGASVGSAHGGALTLSDAYRAMRDRGPDRVSPFAIPLSLTNVAAAGVARTLGLRGPSSAPCTACAATDRRTSFCRLVEGTDLRRGRARCGHRTRTRRGAYSPARGGTNGYAGDSGRSFLHRPG